MSIKNSENEKTCFIVSPIGKEGAAKYIQFKDVLDYIFKPAIENLNMGFNVLRADEITKPGSFVKDIVDNLASAYLVLVDMTGQNPNVFYELGIRHALSNRTILVSQSLDDIPSDLREYRTIIYDTTAKGSALFSQQLKKFFDEIEKDPEQPDNPVRANLPEISDKRIEEYELTIKNLKEELTNTLQGKKTKIKLLKPNNLLKRINRIITLKNAVQQYKSVLREDTFTETQDGKKIGYKIPVEQNHFKLFFVIDKGSSISEFWYLNQYISIENYKDELSDIRILLEKCSKKQPCNPKFILATEDNLGDIRSEIMNSFNKMLNFIDENERKKFSLEIWDEKGLISFEKELGIIV